MGSTSWWSAAGRAPAHASNGAFLAYPLRAPARLIAAPNGTRAPANPLSRCTRWQGASDVASTRHIRFDDRGSGARLGLGPGATDDKTACGSQSRSARSEGLREHGYAEHDGEGRSEERRV